LNSPYLAVAAAMLVTFVLGSVHAFSVFIAPLEALLRLPRAEISLIYSLALVALTVSVLVGYRIYHRLAPASLVLLTCLAAAAGTALAALVPAWWALCVGYSLVFGLSNGIGYGYCLQLAGRVMPRRRGFAMGAVTATYAVGSVVFAKVFAWRIAAAGVDAALFAVAAALLAGGAAAALMLRASGASYGLPGAPNVADDSTAGSGVAIFWLAYLGAVFAGLMAIGHAAGIALSRDATPQLATGAAVAAGIGSALGGFVAGWMIGRWGSGRLLVGLPLLSAVALLAMAVHEDAFGTVMLLSLVGFAYGSLIAVYPVAIAERYRTQGPRVYGRVFTAWGCAGLAGPWSAGWIFDWRGGYETALLAAAGIALLSSLCARAIRPASNA
jgi:OFA family oxalate/formate antiporter-like MFS transporter